MTLTRADAVVQNSQAWLATAGLGDGESDGGRVGEPEPGLNAAATAAAAAAAEDALDAELGQELGQSPGEAMPPLLFGDLGEGLAAPVQGLAAVRLDDAGRPGLSRLGTTREGHVASGTLRLPGLTSSACARCDGGWVATRNPVAERAVAQAQARLLGTAHGPGAAQPCDEQVRMRPLPLCAHAAPC